MMGYEPQALPMVAKRSHLPAVEQRFADLQRARDEALASHELARQVMKQRITRSFTPFKKGDKVWLEARNLKLNYENRKLAPRREGPFSISEVLSPITYRLKLPTSWKIHNVFHASLLTPYRENTEHGKNFLEPPPDLVDGEEEYEVEAILSHKGTARRRRYLIKWKGYPSSENSWEAEPALKGAKDVLAAYKKRKRL